MLFLCCILVNIIIINIIIKHIILHHKQKLFPKIDPLLLAMLNLNMINTLFHALLLSDYVSC